MIHTLVVDDDFMVAQLHRTYVERVPGFTVVGEAHTASAAVERASHLRPDLVLLDIYLPDRSGLQVLRELRTLQPSPDVIVATAARDVPTLREAMRGGVVHYLVKPFTFPALHDRLLRYAALTDRLQRLHEADQHEVNRLYALLRTEQAELPKGLSHETLALVCRVLEHAAGGVSAAEVSQSTGMSRVTARRYLEHLRVSGQCELHLRYGVSGRPEHRYHPTST